jgi:hypothetical protein
MLNSTCRLHGEVDFSTLEGNIYFFYFQGTDTQTYPLSVVLYSCETLFLVSREVEIEGDLGS